MVTRRSKHEIIDLIISKSNREIIDLIVSEATYGSLPVTNTMARHHRLHFKTSGTKRSGLALRR